MKSASDFQKFLSLISSMKEQEELLLDKSGVILDVNQSTTDISGYERAELVGHHLSILYPAEKREQALADLQRAAKLTQVVVFGVKIRKSGRPFWAKLRIQARFLDGEEVFKASLHDVTYRALSNFRVQAIREEYQTIFNNQFIGVFKFSTLDYKVLTFNQKALSMIKTRVFEGFYFNELFYSVSEFSDFISELLSRRRIDGKNFRMKDGEDGQERWMIVAARCFEHQRFAEGVILDVTHQHHQAAQLQKVNKQLHKFTYHASHDLRAPLTTIKGLLNLMSKKTEDVELYLGMVAHQVDRLDLLLKDLTIVSQNYEDALQVEAVDFQTEINALTKDLTCLHPLDLQVAVEQHAPFVTDAYRLRTIIRSILLNAVSYFNPSVLVHQISVAAKVFSNYAYVEVIDNGIGIDPRYHEKIYDLFFRGTTRSIGSGLGLYIARSMAERVGGKIEVESRLLEGSKFSLTFPNLQEDKIDILKRRQLS